MLRLQAAAIAGLLLAGGVRVATYSEPVRETSAVEVWQRLLTARSARVRMASDVSVAGRAPVRITVAGVVEPAARRSSLVVERDGKRLYDEVVADVMVYVRPKARWFSFRVAAPDPQRPLAVIALLPDAGPLRPRGVEDVDFVETTRYSTTSRGLALDLWVGEDGLPRRIVVYEGPNTRTVLLSDFLIGDPVGVPLGAIGVSNLDEALRRAAAG